MRDAGLPLEEIGDRVRRSPEFVSRIIGWTQIPRSSDSGEPTTLRPLERRVLQLREEGQDHETIADRFRKSVRFIRQVEGLAHFKKGLSLLSASAAAARAGEDGDPRRD